MENKQTKLDSFQEWAHRWGRVGTVIALAYMIALPFIVLGYYGCIPSFGEIFNVSTFGILAIYIPVGFSEALSYTPILGCSAYLAFITGNIIYSKTVIESYIYEIVKNRQRIDINLTDRKIMTHFISVITVQSLCRTEPYHAAFVLYDTTGRKNAGTPLQIIQALHGFFSTRC